MPDFRIIVDVKNVAKGDIKTLVEELHAHDEDFDAARGEFVIRTLAREGSKGERYFDFDIDEDE